MCRRGRAAVIRSARTSPGNSLGLQPVATRRRLEQELDDWARLGVEGHREAARPWVSYHELLRDPAARLVGALPAETVMMNSLTVNLHLLMIELLPTDGRPVRDPHRGQRVPLGQLRRSQPGGLARLRSGRGGDPAPAANGRGRAAQRGHRGFPRPGGTTRRAGLARRGELLQRRAAGHPRDHRAPDMRPARSSAGTSRTQPATSRCHCTTGTSTGPRGAPTSTSTAGPVPWRAHSSTNAIWPTALCRSSAAGGARTRRRGSDGPGARCRSPRPTPGSCPTRRSWRWRRCSFRWRCSTRSA